VQKLASANAPHLSFSIHASKKYREPMEKKIMADSGWNDLLVYIFRGEMMKNSALNIATFLEKYLYDNL